MCGTSRKKYMMITLSPKNNSVAEINDDDHIPRTALLMFYLIVHFTSIAEGYISVSVYQGLNQIEQKPLRGGPLDVRPDLLGQTYFLPHISARTRFTLLLTKFFTLTTHFLGTNWRWYMILFSKEMRVFFVSDVRKWQYQCTLIFEALVKKVTSLIDE